MIDRREFLRRAGLTGTAAVAATVVGPGRPLARADESLAPFLHGVASGDPLSDRVVLWTRVTTDRPGDVAVRVLVATDVGMTDVVRDSVTLAVADRDHTVKVDADGLRPDTHYFYAFEADGVRSLVGRTRTAPAPGQPVDHLRYAVVSCSSYQHGLFNVYARISDRDDIAAVLHAGDYLYEYAPGQYGDFRAHEPDAEYVTLAQYRTRYAQYRLDPDLRRLHQVQPFVVTWDDHESTDNSYRDGANNHQPETEGDWGVRKATAQRAYDEWMPIRSTGDPNLIHRALDWGDLVDVIVLDTRLEGRDEQLKYPGTETEALGGLLLYANDPDRRLVSDQQMAWLKDRLRHSDATWKVVLQQVIVSGWNAGGLPRLTDEGPDVPLFLRDGGNAINPDSWDGYAAQRNELLDFLREEGIDNTVVLTGDVHSSWAFDMTPDPFNPVTRYDPLTGDGAVGVEFVVPGVTSPPLAEALGGVRNGPAIEAAFLAGNPQMKMSETRHNGCVTLDITPARVQADWWFVDTVTEPSDVETWHAGWVTEVDSNHLVPAAAPAVAADPAPATPDALLVTAAPAPAPATSTTPGAASVPPTRPTTASEPATSSVATGTMPATGGGALVAGVAAIAAATVVRRRTRER